MSVGRCWNYTITKYVPPAETAYEEATLSLPDDPLLTLAHHRRHVICGLYLRVLGKTLLGSRGEKRNGLAATDPDLIFSDECYVVVITLRVGLRPAEICDWFAELSGGTFLKNCLQV